MGLASHREIRGQRHRNALGLSRRDFGPGSQGGFRAMLADPSCSFCYLQVIILVDFIICLLIMIAALGGVDVAASRFIRVLSQPSLSLLFTYKINALLDVTHNIMLEVMARAIYGHCLEQQSEGYCIVYNDYSDDYLVSVFS